MTRLNSIETLVDLSGSPETGPIAQGVLPTRPLRPGRSMRRSLARAVLIAALAGGVAGLAGCDQSDPIQAAMARADVRLTQATLGSERWPDSVKRKQIFAEVLKELLNLESKGNLLAGNAAAASLLRSRANAGLGELAAQEAAAREATLAQQSTQLRSLVGRWVSQNALASTLRSYDPTSDLAKIDVQISERAKEAQKAEAEKAVLGRQLGEMASQADALESQSKIARESLTRLRAESSGVSAVNRASTIEQSALQRRSADELDKQAAELRAQLASAEPRLAELTMFAAQLATQQRLLEESKAQLRARGEAGIRQSDAAKADAMTVGARIDKLLPELIKSREEALAPSQEAARAYQASAGEASKSAQVSRTAGKTAGASADAAVGDTLAARARSLADAADVLEALASAAPALSSAGQAREALSKVRQDSASALEEAKAAYDKAIKGFETSGATDSDTKARVATVTASLKRLIEPRAALAPKGDGGKPGATGESTMASADASSVEAEVRQWLVARDAESKDGKLGDVLSHMSFKNDAAKAFFSSTIPVLESVQGLNAAAKAKFGKDVAGLMAESANPAVKSNPILAMMLGNGGGLGGLGGVGNVGKLVSNPAEAKIIVTSASEAQVEVGEGAPPVKLVKVEGAWKAVVELPPAMAGMAGMISQQLGGVGAVFAEITKGTQDGKFATGDDLLIELNKALMVQLQKMGPGGGDGG